MDSNESSLNYEQALAIKEFTNISKILMNYDNGKVQSNNKSISEIMLEIINDYDSLLSKYKIMEAQLIETKIKYAEAEEVKERLIFDIENKDQFDNNFGKASINEKRLLSTKTENSRSSHVLKSNASTGFLSRASHLFSSASNYYNGKFDSNS